MVTWGRALKAALVLLAFAILWGIIGIVIMAVGTFVGALGMFQITPEPPYVNINFASLGVVIVIWIVGALIMFLGTWASAFKIATDLALEEMRKAAPVTVAPSVMAQATQATAAPTPTCHKCGTPLTYIQQYQRWYCPNCREYR